MSPFRKVFLLAVNDLRLLLRDRAGFLWLLVLPLAFMWFFGQLGGGGDTEPKISLQVENHDSGWLSTAFLEELEDESVLLQRVEIGDDVRRVRTLVIPDGFTAGVLAGDKQTVILEAESGSNMEFGIAAQMHVVRVIARTLARLVEIDAESGGRRVPAPGAFAALADRPPLVAVEVSTAGRRRGIPSGFNQSVPGTMTFIVLMMTMIYGGVFLATERQSGMLRRQATLPLTRRQIFYGKLTGRLFIAGIQLVVLLLAGRFLFGVDWGTSPMGLGLVLVTYSAATASLSTFLGAVVKTPEQASGIGWLASMVLGALGGCWWPAEVMPRWLWKIAHTLPTTWAMDAFHALISFGRGVEAVLIPSAILTAFAIVFAALGARYLKIS